MTITRTERRILSALTTGPMLAPVVDRIAGRRGKRAVRDLVARGLVERAGDCYRRAESEAA